MWGWCFWAVMAASLWLPTSWEYTCRGYERTSLLDFKSGLLDRSERTSSWKGYNCCEWEGVVCDSVTGHVIELHLSSPRTQKQIYNRSLSGNIRGSLFQLKQLQFLDLSFNSFDGLPIPSQLGSLRKLAYLNLSNAGFSGQIPEEIGNMSALRHLDLSSSYYVSVFSLKLEKPNLGTWLRNLTGLTYLSLDGVNISTVASEQWGAAVGSLSSLEHLHMSYCGLSGRIPSSLANLTSLSHLHLDGNYFSSIPPWLGNLSSLRSLQLSDCNLSGSIPSDFFRFGLLQNLFLANNPLLKGSLPVILQAHFSLNRLVLSRTDVGGQIPSSIANMTSMTVLDLSNTRIGGRIPPSIANLSELVKLDLSGSRLRGQIPPVGGLISLTHLDLSDNQLEGRVPPSLGGLQDLSYIDLSANKLDGGIPFSMGNLTSLTQLDLSKNQLSGSIPFSFCNLSSLITLDLSRNLLSGGIPSFSNNPPPRMRTLNLSENRLNSTIPDAISNLFKLNVLSLSFNGLVGTVSTSLLDNLTALSSLDLSENRFTVDISPIWIPPFRLNSLQLRSCRIVGDFPAFVITQNDMYILDLSNNNLTGGIPAWLWDQLPNLQHLNLSHNKLEGQLPPFLSPNTLEILDLHANRLQGALPLPPCSLSVLDLSENQFNGSIPQTIGEHTFNAIFVSFSGNNLSNGIPYSICDGNYLEVLDLSKNKLSGSLPASFVNCSTLSVLNLAKNDLEGEIPRELENATNLRTLNLNGNRLNGSIPPSLAKCKALEILDLGYNEIQGSFPDWIGSLHGLRILVLRSNNFRGNIRLDAASLANLQILDLFNNSFSGIIPESITELSAMAKSSQRSRILDYKVLNDLYYVDRITVTSKGQDIELVKVLTILTCIDLSGNDFSGDIPVGIGSLKGLIILNISRNHISGQIPNSLGGMVQLESLDLSRNKLHGIIPSELLQLTFLSYLDLSYNTLSGKIPQGNQFATFSPSSFLGNADLCGFPVSANCSRSEPLGNGKLSPSPKIGVPSNKSIDWRMVVMGMSFGMGIGVVTAPLLFVRTWRKKYFELVDGVVVWMLDLLKWREVCRDKAEQIEEEPEFDEEIEGVRRFCIRCTHIDRVTKNVIHTSCNCPSSPATDHWRGPR